MIWVTIMVDAVEFAQPLVHSQTRIHPFNHVSVENSRSKHLFGVAVKPTLLLYNYLFTYLLTYSMVQSPS